ncbi:hypothetical protein ACFSYD_14925 [Paracoccus aerius]
MSCARVTGRASGADGLRSRAHRRYPARRHSRHDEPSPGQHPAPDAVRTVARRDFGWRLIYHPARAPAGADQGAARALCGLERRAVARIERIPRVDPYVDPGAAIIDVYCA